MSDDLTGLAEIAIRAAQGEFEEVTKVTWKSVQSSARTFISAYDKYQNQENFSAVFRGSIINQLNRLQNQNIEENKKELNNLIIKAFENNQSGVIRALYSLAFNFQTAFQKALGETPSKVAYVTKSGRIYTGSIQRLALGANLTSSGVRIQGLSSLLQQEKINSVLIDAYKGIKEQLEKYYLYIYSKTKDLSDEEKEAIKYYDKKGRFQKQIGYIPENGKYRRIQNYGDLGEGFIYAWRNLTKEDTKESATEKILKGVSLVDSVAGAITEDVDEYAVKIQKAALPSLKPYYDQAKMVIKNPKKFFQQQNNSIKEHIPGVRNLLFEDLPSIQLQGGTIDLKDAFK